MFMGVSVIIHAFLYRGLSCERPKHLFIQVNAIIPEKDICLVKRITPFYISLTEKMKDVTDTSVVKAPQTALRQCVPRGKFSLVPVLQLIDQTYTENHILLL